MFKCPKILLCKGTSTFHKIKIEAKNNLYRSQVVIQQTFSFVSQHYTKTKTVAEILEQCVAEDWFSVNSLRKSKMT